MADEQGPAPDWIQNLIRDFQDRLTCGLYEAIYKLDDRSAERLMQAQARTCVGAFLKLSDLRIPMELDEFLHAMRTAGPSQVDIQRQGDVIDWIEQHHGECVCPFVRRKVVRLDPKLCSCGAHWVQGLFATVAQTPVEVETVKTVATGSQNCRYRIRLKGNCG